MIRLKKEHILIAEAELLGEVRVSETRRHWRREEAKSTEVALEMSLKILAVFVQCVCFTFKRD